MSTVSIFGFTLLRNGIKYDYPFRESLQSLCALCETVYVALGKSEDNTESVLGDFKNLKIIPTVWDENSRKSGLVLSEQTNIALTALRAEHSTNAWGIYLQADEVLNPDDFEQLKKDIFEAEKLGCDAISFRYLHFWQSYHKIAVTKRWYPQEIRAIRLNSNAVSYGDAQSFKPCENIYYSDVPVFHYGHVREAEAYERKKKDFNRWWHKDEELEKVVSRGEKREKYEKILSYLGPHSRFMKNKIYASQVSKRKILVYGVEENYSKKFLGAIHAELRWTKNWIDLLKEKASETVILDTTPWFFPIISGGKFQSQVPQKMFSPQARPWTKEFRALLKFSEKGISVL